MGEGMYLMLLRYHILFLDLAGNSDICLSIIHLSLYLSLLTFCMCMCLLSHKTHISCKDSEAIQITWRYRCWLDWGAMRDRGFCHKIHPQDPHVLSNTLSRSLSPQATLNWRDHRWWTEVHRKQHSQKQPSFLLLYPFLSFLFRVRIKPKALVFFTFQPSHLFQISSLSFHTTETQTLCSIVYSISLGNFCLLTLLSSPWPSHPPSPHLAHHCQP